MYCDALMVEWMRDPPGWKLIQLEQEIVNYCFVARGAGQRWGDARQRN